MKIIAISNFKGGVGKTTLAREIAGYYHVEQYSVGVVDLNQEITGLESFYKNRKNNKVEDEFGQMVALGGPTILPFSPSTIMDVEKRFEEDSAALMRLVQTGLQKQLDYLILDCPGMDVDFVYAAHRLADHIITPIQLRGGDFNGFAKPVNLLSVSKEARASGKEHLASFPHSYPEMVRMAMQHSDGVPRWSVVTSKRNPGDDPEIGDQLRKIASQPTFGFELIDGLKDRLIHHKPYNKGLCLADFENVEAAQAFDPKMTDETFKTAKADLASIAAHIDARPSIAAPLAITKQASAS